MRIPKNYYDLPLRRIQQARIEAQIILNDLTHKGTIDENLEMCAAMLGAEIIWFEEAVADAVAKARTRKSAIKTRRGGKAFTSLAPLQPSEQASE